MSPDTWILSDYKLHAHVIFHRHPFVYGFCVDLIGLIWTLCMQPKCCPREVICIGVVRCSTRKILQEKTLSLSCCICFTKYKGGIFAFFIILPQWRGVGIWNPSLRKTVTHIYSISQEMCTRFCCALLCCGYAIVHNEFTVSFYPY